MLSRVWRWIRGQAFYMGHGLRFHYPIAHCYKNAGDWRASLIVCVPCERGYDVLAGRTLDKAGLEALGDK